MSSLENSKHCQCSSEGFFITNRQTSMLCALLIILFMMTFISGYFWGHGRATQDFTERLVEDSFTDKINYAFYSNFEKSPTEPEVENESEEDFEEAEDTQPVVAVKVMDVPQENNSSLSLDNKPFSDKLFYAELIGFGSMPAAQQFAQKALRNGYNVDIKQRLSRTAKGKSIYWFQAVTEKFENKDQLLDLVAKIQKAENIKDVKIIEEINQQSKG